MTANQRLAGKLTEQAAELITLANEVLRRDPPAKDGDR
jgi:hypothetical protein